MCGLAVLAVLTMLTALAVLTLCLQDTARVNLGSFDLLCLLQLLYLLCLQHAARVQPVLTMVLCY